MTDRLYTSGGPLAPSRQQSPAQNNPKYHFDSVNEGLGAQAESPAPSHTHRRPSRTSSSTSHSHPPRSASPSCLESTSGSDKRTKSQRTATLKRPVRRDSGCTETSVASQQPERQDWYETSNEGTAFLPKLSRIREGKASKTSKSRASSTVSSALGPKSRRRQRHMEDNAVDQARERQRRGGLQRHSDNFASLSNPSLVSLDSGVTQPSHTSGASSSTETRRSHDNGGQEMTLEPPYQERRPAPQGAFHSQTLPTMDAPRPDVFQFLAPDSQADSFVSEDTHHMTPPTTLSSTPSSPHDTRLHNDGSSTPGTFPHEMESPASSPASTRKSDNDQFHYQGREYRKPGAPLYASSFVHGHEVEEEEDEEEDDDGNGDENKDEEDSNHSDGSEEQDEDSKANESGEAASGAESEEAHHDDAHGDPADLGPAPSLALDKVPPPIAPSTSSRPSDPHTRRLRQQERKLASHVLQSPRPQRDFQFGVDASAEHVSMPLYHPYAYSGPSPAASQSLPWPPVPPLPAPLPIGYSPHHSPEGSNAFPLTVRSPAEAMQQMPPPFPPHLGQPPVYQPHAPAPDLSRKTVIGYELLAEKLSKAKSAGGKRSAKPGKGSIVPMYRKFEHLNHRVLLHLQDEVSEMEEELRHLDEVIAQTSPRDDSGRCYPGSRRGDARFGGESHYRRTELLGRIFQKLGQYNQALCSFQSLLKELEPTTTEDVQAYRSWMEKRTPIDYTEARFLSREQDLVVVSRKSSAVGHDDVAAAHHHDRHHSAAVWFPLTLTFPLMAFAVIPNVLGRLVIVALICSAELWMVRATAELRSFLSRREWVFAAIGYFGVMALLAGLAR